MLTPVQPEFEDFNKNVGTVMYNYNGMYPVQPIPVQPPQINQQQQSSSYPSYPQPIQQPIIYGAGFIYP